jgi:putative acetyltransferase
VVVTEKLHIRPETPDDKEAIYQLTKTAFARLPYADGDEQDLINALREAGALSLSLVAIMGDEVIGHVAFSPALAEDSVPNWFALGPVSVAPLFQRRGIGSALIRNAIGQLADYDAAGIILVGNPNYYARFGFVVTPELTPPGQPIDYFMVLPLACKEPKSVVHFHPLFGAGH